VQRILGDDPMMWSVAVLFGNPPWHRSYRSSSSTTPECSVEIASVEATRQVLMMATRLFMPESSLNPPSSE
jgi:hypothetical protein